MPLARCLFLLVGLPGKVRQPIYAILLSISTLSASAQVPAPDSSSLTGAVSYATRLYTEAFGRNTHLLNGSEYVAYGGEGYAGHPFFGSDAPKEGSLFYDGFFYPRIELLYDIKLDQLIVQPPGARGPISLASPRVRQFELYHRTFVYLAAAAAPPAGAGFYDLLQDGKVRLLAKRRKTLLETTTKTGKEGQFTQHDELFVQEGASFHPVSSAKQIPDLLPAQRDALRQYARRHQSDTPESAIIALVGYYNSLQ